MLNVTPRFIQHYPGARMGILAVARVINPPSHSGLEKEKNRLEAALRKQYGSMPRESLVTLPVMQPYVEHYRAFRKTYHVLLQLESIAQKGRSLPKVAALVEAMFMAELKNLMLTAGHDLDVVEGGMSLDLAGEGDTYTLIGGQDVTAKKDDMLVRDSRGVLSSVVYGPDSRTSIRENTRRAVFTVYAPKGIPAARLAAHLEDLEGYIRMISPHAEILVKKIFPG
jgi:DNA/RNA-binding domain of Phe-tRNA-synthetase-like protein